MGITSRLTSSFCRPGQENSNITNRTAVGEMVLERLYSHTGGKKKCVIILTPATANEHPFPFNSAITGQLVCYAVYGHLNV